MRKKLLLVLILLLTSPAAGLAAPVIMVLGDSLSAAYGIDQNRGWVYLLQQRLEGSGYNHRVANVSLSGETTSGALSRLPRELERHRPDIVIVELGGNDGLRGLPLNQIQTNLAAIIAKIQARGATVLLAGMQLPPNYGPAYTSGFHRVFERVATEQKTAFVPFLLEGLDRERADFQADGIHPTIEAQAVILENVWSQLEAMLK